MPEINKNMYISIGRKNHKNKIKKRNGLPAKEHQKTQQEKQKYENANQIKRNAGSCEDRRFFIVNIQF